MGRMGDLLRKILPPEGIPRRLCTQQLVFAIGHGTYLTGSVVFFSLYVGLSAVQIGIGFSLVGFLTLVCSLPMGHLADRIGGKPAWVIGALGGSASFFCYPLAHSFWAFLVVLSSATLFERLGGSGRAVYSAAATPPEIRMRTMAFGRAYLNVGFTIGSGLGAAALALDSRTGLLALVLLNACVMLINATFVSRLPHVHAEASPGSRPSPWGVLRDHPFTALAGVFAVIGLSETIFSELLPLWAVTMTDAPKPILGALFALNTILAVTLQVPATRGADGPAGVVRLMRWSGIATALACPVAALSGATRGWETVAILALAVVLVTGTELWSSASQWWVLTEMPPPAQRGVYQGASTSVQGIFKMIGPAAMTFLAIRTGGWGWWVIAAFFAACAAAVSPAMAWASRTPRNGVSLTPTLVKG
jgi:hypothetical protein